MVVIERRDPYGNKGYKSFNNLEEAYNFLDSDKVKQDINDGFTFSFKEDDNLNGG